MPHWEKMSEIQIRSYYVREIQMRKSEVAEWKKKQQEFGANGRLTAIDTIFFKGCKFYSNFNMSYLNVDNCGNYPDKHKVYKTNVRKMM